MICLVEKQQSGAGRMPATAAGAANPAMFRSVSVSRICGSHYLHRLVGAPRPQNETPMRQPLRQTMLHFFLVPPEWNSNLLGSDAAPPSSRQAPLAEISTIVHSMLGTLGSTTILPSLEENAGILTRTCLRLSFIAMSPTILLNGNAETNR